jgi:hypothetical protein
MSEDGGQAGDGAGIWRDPSGILALGEPTNSHQAGHKVIIICDSHTSLLARLAVRKSAPGETTRRGICPGCGRRATLKIVGGTDG